MAQQRTPEQILKEIQRHERRVEEAEESTGVIEELEHEYAQATASLFILMSERLVPHDDDEQPTKWEHDVFGVSEKRAFTKMNMRLRAKGQCIHIQFYDFDDLIITLHVHVNERSQFSTPSFKDPGEIEYVFNAFRTRKEAEECQTVLDSRQSASADSIVN